MLLKIVCELPKHVHFISTVSVIFIMRLGVPPKSTSTVRRVLEEIQIIRAEDVFVDGVKIAEVESATLSFSRMPQTSRLFREFTRLRSHPLVEEGPSTDNSFANEQNQGYAMHTYTIAIT